MSAAEVVPNVEAITPEPTDAEMAAILAAYSELWPRPVEPPSSVPASPAWRFSGRWWK